MSITPVRATHERRGYCDHLEVSNKVEYCNICNTYVDAAGKLADIYCEEPVEVVGK